MTIGIENIIAAVFLFIIIWIASSGIISGVTRISVKIKIPLFLISFLLLGALTSSTEMALAINSHFEKVPQISIGNLLGGIIVLFLLIIPILAISANGISIENNYKRFELLLTLIAISLPSFVFLDGQVSFFESLILIAGYILPVALLVTKHRDFSAKRGRIPNSVKNTRIYVELAKVIIAGLVLLVASDRLVVVVTNIAIALQVTPFIVSLVTLSIGTNLPEMVLVIRAVISGQKEVALGNFIGSALMNILIVGVITVLNPGMFIDSNFMKIFFFTVLGTFMFFIFVSSKNELSRREGSILLLCYIAFIVIEISPFILD